MRILAVDILTSAAMFLSENHPVAHHVVYALFIVLPLAAWRILAALVPGTAGCREAVTMVYSRLHRLDLVLVTLLVLAAGPAACTMSITAVLRATGTPDPGVFDVIWFFYSHITESPCDGGLAVIVFLAIGEAFAIALMPPPPPPPAAGAVLVTTP